MMKSHRGQEIACANFVCLCQLDYYGVMGGIEFVSGSETCIDESSEVCSTLDVWIEGSQNMLNCAM